MIAITTNIRVVIIIVAIIRSVISDYPQNLMTIDRSKGYPSCLLLAGVVFLSKLSLYNL